MNFYRLLRFFIHFSVIFVEKQKDFDTQQIHIRKYGGNCQEKS